IERTCVNSRREDSALPLEVPAAHEAAQVFFGGNRVRLSFLETRLGFAAPGVPPSLLRPRWGGTIGVGVICPKRRGGRRGLRGGEDHGDACNDGHHTDQAHGPDRRKL